MPHNELKGEEEKAGKMLHYVEFLYVSYEILWENFNWVKCYGGGRG